MTSSTITHPMPSIERRQPSTHSAIPFPRLIRVEWGKATDTRAARWLMVLVLASTTALMLAPFLAATKIEQSYTSYLGYAALGLTVLLPVVSILTLTSEWSQHTVLATFTQEPRRTRVINAKIVVSLILAGGGAVFGLLLTAAALGVAAASGRELDSNLSTNVLVGYLCFVLLNVLTGVAYGALLHNSSVAIVLYFALPTAFALLGMAVKPVADWIDTSTTFNWLIEGRASEHLAEILVSATIWIVIPLTAGLVRTVRREIT